ncbi:MAG: helix-turn-helix domain-containing protein [Terriglobia bacterium]
MPQFQNTGELLRNARKKFELTQEQFALILGVKLSRLQKWESGVNEPRFTIPELRRFREINREMYDVLMSGFLILPPPPIAGSAWQKAQRELAQRREEQRRGHFP